MSSLVPQQGNPAAAGPLPDPRQTHHPTEATEARLREVEAEREALRERLETELRASEDRYRALFDSIDEGFCIVRVIFDDDGRPVDYRFLEVNASFAAQTGLANAIGRTMRSLRPDHEEHWFEIYGRVARTGESLRFDRPAAALGRWYTVYAFRVGEPDEHRVGILFNDVTAQRRMELSRDALAERLASDLAATERLHALSTRLVEAGELPAVLEQILEATIALQGAAFGNIQLYDRDTDSLRIAVQRGFSPRFLEHFRVVDVAETSACGRALRARVRTVIEDIELDPEYAPHLDVARGEGYRAVQSTPIIDRDGAPIGMLSTHFREPHRPSERDLRLTDLYLRLAAELIGRARHEDALREAKEEAERASRAKSQFLSTISHELRTPLTAVIGLADLLRREVVGSVTEKQRKHLDRISASAWHLVAIIDEILTFTRSEAGKEEPRLASVDVAAVARSVVEMLLPEAETRGLALRLGGAEAPLPAITDEGKLRQILVNLLGNAVRYTDRGGIDLTLAARPEWLEVRVHDTGVGIPAARLEDIFKPFVQVDGSSRRKRGGTGLGLAICRRLARLLGGDIGVESEPGAGSTFTLHLPRGDAGAE